MFQKLSSLYYLRTTQMHFILIMIIIQGKVTKLLGVNID